MHSVDIRTYEAGMNLGGPKGEVKLCPHCSKPGCRIGSVHVGHGERQPKVAHRVTVGHFTRKVRRGEKAGKVVTELKAKWSDVCGLPKKLTKEERATLRVIVREARKLEKAAERKLERARKRAAKAAARKELQP